MYNAPVIGVWIGVKVITIDSPTLIGLLLPEFEVTEINPDPTTGLLQLRPPGGVIVAEETEKPLGITILADPKLFPESRLVMVTLYCWFMPGRKEMGLIVELKMREP